MSLQLSADEMFCNMTNCRVQRNASSPLPKPPPCWLEMVSLTIRCSQLQISIICLFCLQQRCSFATIVLSGSGWDGAGVFLWRYPCEVLSHFAKIWWLSLSIALWSQLAASLARLLLLQPFKNRLIWDSCDSCRLNHTLLLATAYNHYFISVREQTPWTHSKHCAQ